MAKYALLNGATVVNIVEWDGNTATWNPAPLVAVPYNPLTHVVPPPPPAEPDPIDQRLLEVEQAVDTFRAVTSADQAVTAATQTAVTGLTDTPTAAGTYRVQALLAVTSAAATTGARPNVTATGSPSTFAYRNEVAPTATTTAVSHGVAGTATAGLTTQTLVTIDALVRYATAPTGAAITVTMASEVAGSAVTIKAGSLLTVRKIA